MKATTLLTVLLIALTIYIVNANVNTTNQDIPVSHTVVNGYNIYVTPYEGDYIVEVLKETETVDEIYVSGSEIDAELSLVIDFCKSH